MGVLQGMQMPLYIVANNIFLALVDIIGNYLFLNVLELGPVGSPLGINVAFVGSLIYALTYLLNGPVKDSFTLKPWKQMLPMKENISLFQDGFSLLTRSFLVEFSIYFVAMSCVKFGNANLIAYNTVLGELSKYSYFIPMGLATTSNMLGGYLLGKKDIDGFRRLLTFIPIGGFTLGIFFLFMLFITGPTFWTSFFLSINDPMYSAICASVQSLWLIILLIQPINSMLAVYEGLLYASQSFGYVRNTIIIGFILVFLPLFLIGSLSEIANIKLVILSKVAFDAFRALSYAFKVHFKLSNDIYLVNNDIEKEIKIN
jgi:Na+-driven multidrug efflux pump